MCAASEIDQKSSPSLFSSPTIKAINNKLVAISFYPETRHASRDTSNNLLLLEDFISILLSDRCVVGGEFIS